MKKYNTLQLLTATTFMAVAIFMSATAIAHATTGGETLISNIYYNTQTKSIIYTSQNNGGRGCPPDLIAQNTVTAQTKYIFDCEDDTLPAKYPSFIARNADYVKDFQPMSPVNIKKLGLGITITKLSEEKLEGDNWLIRTKFRMVVTQNGLKMHEQEITGCSVEQPWVIGGYVAADLKNKMALLVSGKGDCFEGGYTTERLLIVPAIIEGAEYLNEYKGSFPLVPTVGNFVVYAQAEAAAVKPAQDTDTSPLESTRSLLTLVGFCVVTFVLGLFAGRLTQRSTPKI